MTVAEEEALEPDVVEQGVHQFSVDEPYETDGELSPEQAKALNDKLFAKSPGLSFHGK